MASLEADATAQTPWSHDKNLLNFAHRCLAAGHEVLFADSANDRFAESPLRITQLLPEIAKDRRLGHDYAVGCDFVLCAYPEALTLRYRFPTSTLVGWFAACHFLETAEGQGATYWSALSTSLSTMDVAVTQHLRMREIIHLVARILGRRDLTILEAPQRWPIGQPDFPDSASARLRIGIPVDARVILNAGGVWSWTDFLPFVKAFSAHLDRQPRSNLFLLVSGLAQPGNHDHQTYVMEALGVMETIKRDHRDRIHWFSDWSEGGRRIRDMLAAADLGLNVNAEGLEAWQAYRIRAVDYLSAGLPMLATPHDFFADVLCPSACMQVQGHSVVDYEAVLDEVEGLTPDQWALLKTAAEDARTDFASRDIYGDLLNSLLDLRPS